MVKNPPKIEIPAPRRLGVGSWWTTGFWARYPDPNVTVHPSYEVFVVSTGVVVR